jgi:hypothetical protein
MPEFLTKKEFDENNKKIRNELLKDAARVKASLEKHIDDDKPRWAVVDETIKNLSYLGEKDFKDSLTLVVKDKENQTWLSKRIMSFLGVMAIVATIIGSLVAAILTAWHYIRG